MLAGQHRMLAPHQGPSVLKVQQGLLDLGYGLGPKADDAWFGTDTGRAVTKFKTEHDIAPTDPVVGPKTMKALDDIWALPFADREEWRSWHLRELPEWNWTRDDDLNRRRLGFPITLAPTAAWLPAPFKTALVRGLTELLDPFGSPDGPRTPSATWGVGPLDLFHCHVATDRGRFLRSRAMLSAMDAVRDYRRRLDRAQAQAEQAGPRESAPWTRAYRDLLLAPGTPKEPSVRKQAATILEQILAVSRSESMTVSLVWHSFEARRWRPASIQTESPRRKWWNDVSPVPSSVTHTPFDVHFRDPATGDEVLAGLLGLAFLMDRRARIHVMAETWTETSALVDLTMERINAAFFGPP